MAQKTFPINVYWGPWSVVDVEIRGDMKAYQVTLREDRVVDQVALPNRDLLVKSGLS